MLLRIEESTDIDRLQLALEPSKISMNYIKAKATTTHADVTPARSRYPQKSALGKIYLSFIFLGPRLLPGRVLQKTKNRLLPQTEDRFSIPELKASNKDFSSCLNLHFIAILQFQPIGSISF